MKVAVIGLGQRGFNYIRWIKYFAKDVEVVAICDKNTNRADYTEKRFNIPNKFYSDVEFFKEKRADAIIVSTQDRDHYGHCMQALKMGYKHILCEKPVSPNLDEIENLQKEAEKCGADIVVCHVLRYSKYYRLIKSIIKSGEIGDIMDIQHSENVGYFHFAHSFVRGNWHSEEETSPFILAKCCHDFDILYWLIDKPCKSLSSYGSLTYFTKENAPKGSADRCIDCKIKDCPYNAVNTYIKDPLWKATFIRFDGSVITKRYDYKKSDKYDAMKNSDYGKCVYKCDNDVCDHQIINFEFENGVTASHTVNACTDKFMRRTIIYGTKGEIIADDYMGDIRVNVFRGKHYVKHTKLIKGLGHIDGDINIIKGWTKLIKGEKYDTTDVTFLSETIKSHKACIYADISRKNGGKVMELDK